MSPHELLNSSLWFYGPLWLKNENNDWPEDVSKVVAFGYLPETRNESKPFVHTNRGFSFKKYSSSNRIKRVFAYILRFACNFKIIKEANLSSQVT